MNWLSGAFDFDSLAPAEMILARHCEILREDETLVSLFGGAEENPLLIQVCPLGKLLPIEGTPRLFCTLPIVDRKPAPGSNVESVIVRDVVRFHSEQVTSEEDLWEPGLASLISHLVGVVQKYQQLPFDLSTHTAQTGTVMLATRADLPSVSIEQVQTLNESNYLLELRLDFEYTVQVNAKTIPPRLRALTTVGA